MKIQWPEKITVVHLNINLIRSKFDALFFFNDTKIEILLISETKLNDSFASAQFRSKGFCTPSVEINLKKKKLLLICCYNPHRSLISSNRYYLNNILDKYSISYENLVYMGDFNLTMDDKLMIDFWELNDLSSLIDKPRFYKNY